MATNLSSLISDAFTIFSEAYSKIGELGVEVVDLAGSPRQPKKINQLIECTRLYRVIEPSIILNGGGTAIVGVYGSINIINNLLLKLKRCAGLYDLPVFPTPLTDFVFNLGSGGADPDSTFITVITEAGLPQSRRLANGTGILVTDNGAQGTIQIDNTDSLSQLQYAAANPVLNMGGFSERLFYGDGAITGIETWSLTNTGNAKRIQATFTISGLTPGDSTHDQTMWANTTIFTTAGATPSAGVFQPLENREYLLDAVTYDGVNWKTVIF